MSETVIQHYLEDVLSSFGAYKKLAEKALDQLQDEEFFAMLDEESNSVAVIMKHLAGNMLSRWTDFLHSDGEKPDRNRDLEFVIDPQTSRADLMAYWQRGWQCVFAALEPLRPEDFDKKVLIRGEEHTIIQAIDRQMTHYAYHVGQIVFLAKHFRATDWKSLSIPRNRSAEFNRYLDQGNRETDSEHRLDVATKFVRESDK
jgi:hypothetical protein